MEADPRIGKVLQQRYRVVERLAAGGMGVVYRGERLQLGRTVAIKFLHAWAVESADARKRFEIEAQAMSRLQSPACAAVIDFGTDGGAPYLVMEFVAGTTLREALTDGALPPRRALAIMRQVLSGLAHAHGQSIVHRDIKPKNIVLTDVTGFDSQVRILDFGVARLCDASSQLTVGMAVGTPSYMAPEQLSGGSIDPRTDLYSAGVVLFELLTGRKPFEGIAIAVLRMHAEDAPPTLAERLPGRRFSPELEAVLARALAKPPAARFQSAAEMASALDATPEASERAVSLPPVFAPASAAAPAPVPAAAPMPVPGPAPAPAPALAPAQRRWRWPLLAGGAAAAALAIILVLALRSSDSGTGTAPSQAGEPSPPAPSPTSTPTPPAQPSDLDALAELARRDPSAASAKLKRLWSSRPDDPTIPYLLGGIQCERKMWPECFEAYRGALPRYREDPVLIGNLIRSFNSDRYHARGMSFVEREIGAPALPALEATAHDPDTPSHVRARAADVARRLSTR